MILKRLRFGFRSLLLFMLLLSLVLGYFGQQIQSGRQQLRVLEGLNEPRNARYSHHSRVLESRHLVSTLPAFLHWLPLSDKCVEVESLDCSNRRARVEELAEINKLTSLKRLALWDSKLSAEDFEALDGLKDLELLDVHFCPNIDQDELLAGLDRWPKLRKIVLGNFTSHDGKGHYPSDFRQDGQSQGVTSRGLKLLAEHPLKPICDLKVREFTEESLDDLNELRRLETLEVELGHRTGPEIFNQLYLPRLRHLVIKGVNVADLNSLKQRMPSLKVTFLTHSHAFENLDDLLENLPRGIKLEEIDTLCLSGDWHSRHVEGFGDRSELNFCVWVKERAAVSPHLVKHIKRLCVTTQEDERFFDSLKGFKNLDQLSLKGFELSNSDSICQLRQLSHLSFQGCVYTDLDLKHWPQLKSLAVDPSGWYHDDYHEGSRLVGWDQLTHLRRLYVSATTLRVSENLGELPSPEVLEELIMRTSVDSKEHFLRAARFPNLKTAVFNYLPADFEAIVDQHFPKLTNFKGRTRMFDPAEKRFTKAFAPLRDEVVEAARELETRDR